MRDGMEKSQSIFNRKQFILVCALAGLLLLGGVLGLVKCALLLFLAVWVLQKLQLLVTPELVNKTVLLKFFAQNSPIDLIAKL